MTDKTSTDLMLDCGPVLTWLAVYKRPGGVTDYRLGSIPKDTGPLVHAFARPHVWYSKLLLSSAVWTHLDAARTGDDKKENAS